MKHSYVVAAYFSSRESARRVMQLLDTASFGHTLQPFGRLRPITDQHRYAAAWTQPGEWMLTMSGTLQEATIAMDAISRSGEAQAVTIISPYLTLSPPQSEASLIQHWKSVRGELIETLDRQEQQSSTGYGESATAERGIAEAAFENDVFGISLIEHHYIIDGFIERLDSLILKERALKRLPSEQFDSIIVPSVYSLAHQTVSALKKDFSEESLVRWLKHRCSSLELSQSEFQTLNAMLAYRMLELMAAQVQAEQCRDAELHMARFAGARLETLPELELVEYIGNVASVLPHPSMSFASVLLELVRERPDYQEQLAKAWGVGLGVGLVKRLRQAQQDVSGRLEDFKFTVTALRLLVRLDWDDVIERISPAATILAGDPAGAYSNMDAATRGWYRNRVSQLSLLAGKSERWVASNAVECAILAERPEARHVGYYLIDEGVTELARRMNVRLPWNERLARFLKLRPSGTLLGLIGVVMAIISGFFVLSLRESIGFWPAFAVGILALFPVSQISIEIATYILSFAVKPAGLPALTPALPKMKFSGEIPRRYHSAVIVPTLLGSLEGIREEVERLEIRYLANCDYGLSFGLVTDFTDSPRAEMPENASLLEAAIDGITHLAQTYPQGVFFLYHRPQTYNEADDVWMGEERKRGKLEEFNAVITGNRAPDNLLVGDPKAIRALRYVITLDADTELPPGTGRRLVEAMAHPLNAAYLAPDGTTVRRGFGIIQPRVSTNFLNARTSRLAWLMNNQIGIDPYFVNYSDLYHDLAGDAIYHGKGIYDPHVFQAVLSGKLPANRVLSHDLLEGNHVGVALAGDIQLFDAFPPTHREVFMRTHRWTRGDWQVGAWALARVPGPDGQIVNPLSGIGRVKLADNIRRSLVPVGTLALAVFALFQPPVVQQACTVLIVVAASVPLLLYIGRLPMALMGGALPWKDFVSSAALSVHGILLIPRMAVLSFDAIVRAMYRMNISGRKLLEWRTASEAGSSGGFDAVAIVLALSSAALLVVIRPTLWLGLLLVGWLLAPMAQAWLDRRPSASCKQAISAHERTHLRGVSLQIWRFFDVLMSAEHNYLPPDNIQVALKYEVAARTSPTNIGLGFLGWLAFRDLGFVTPDQLLVRTKASLGTLAKLETYEGHIFNWYDTHTLEPLVPRYVSTVDSGNLVASLWTFKQGIEEQAAVPVVSRDSALSMIELLRELAAREPQLSPAVMEELQELAASLEVALGQPGNGYIAVMRLFAAIVPVRSDELLADTHITAQYLVERLVTQATAWINTIDTYLGWFIQLQTPGEALTAVGSADFALWRHKVIAQIPSPTQLVASLDVPDMTGEAAELRIWLDTIIASHHRAAAAARKHLIAIDTISEQVKVIADRTQMNFLYNYKRKAFHIGYNVETESLDPSFYDLLASEARLASFTAIASGQVPVEHWWALGRNYRRTDGVPVLLSWSGTMFEYLMPRLMMREYPGTLLDTAYRNIVKLQRQYAARLEIPWGISESAHSALDQDDTYQYRAFGVPALGMRYGLDQGVVVSPYSTLLALSTDAEAATKNLRTLERLGMRGEMGYFESIDFRRAATITGERGVGVFTYMAHHQGMGLVAIVNALGGDAFQRRFHSDLRVRAAEALLHEHSSMPKKSHQDTSMRDLLPLLPLGGTPVVRSTDALVDLIPKTHLLTNGSYNVMITASGNGYSRLGEMEINRWSKDPLDDSTGSFMYIAEPATGLVWSTAFAPTHVHDETYAVTFTPEKAIFERQLHGVSSRQEVFVAPDHNVEVRTLNLQNTHDKERTFNVCTYLELGLSPHDAQISHPAFNKLFIKVDEVEEQDGVIAFRRPRSDADVSVWSAHLLVNLSRPSKRASVQTDREQFLGRGATLASPPGLLHQHPDAAEYAIDPIAAVTQTVTVAAGAFVDLAAVTIVTETREELIMLANRYRQKPLLNRARQIAWTARQAELQRLQVGVEETKAYNLLAGYLVFPNHYMKSAAKGLVAGCIEQMVIEVPSVTDGIVIAVGDTGDLPLLRQVGVAQQYLAARGINAPIVVLNKLSGASADSLAERILDIVSSLQWVGNNDMKPNIVAVRATELDEGSLRTLTNTARIVLDGADGSLWQQLTGLVPLAVGLERTPLRLAASSPLMAHDRPVDMEFANGYGGFIEGGRAYRIDLKDGRTPPAPWSNIMANPVFGSLVTESGSGFTWSGNSQNYRLSPWRNEPLQDRPGETIYVQNRRTGEVWSPQLIAKDAHTVTTHRTGETCLEGAYGDITYKLTVFVPADRPIPVRIHHLELASSTDRPMDLRITTANELVLGTNREQTQLNLGTRWDDTADIMVASEHGAFGGVGRIAFSAHDLPVYDYTADRAEFVGPLRGQGLPFRLGADHLSERTGNDLDSIAVIRSDVTLRYGVPLVFNGLFGSVGSLSEVAPLVAQLRKPGMVQQLLEETRAWWSELTTKIQITTPSRQTDIMMNTWLPYQVLSARIWGRTGYYQSSGAFGYRDQLQDSLAIVYSRPEITRQLILQAAAHQFEAGDVHHWWQPDTFWGLRSRMTDDRLWLPYVVARYVEITGDDAILHEEVSFMSGRPLMSREMEAYFEASPSIETGTLLEHCRRAIEVSLKFGSHGLPLIGTGDWNDGYNLVGAAGKGESVWLAWFMKVVLQDMASIIERVGHDSESANRYRDKASLLARNVDSSAWDGQWYIRAFYDDGMPLGSHLSDACYIDSLAQTWAVLAGGGDAERARVAMKSAVKMLVDRRHQLVNILAPAFDHGHHNPGYIKGYQPGIRENGGQYTHGSLWMAMALARLGDTDQAVGLLEMMNPIRHASSKAEADRYVLEPYVTPGDVYSLKGFEGRGGWSWYTGSAAWMYRIWLEEILGFTLRGDTLQISPNIPPDWPTFHITYRYGTTTYRIHVTNPDHVNSGVVSQLLDGSPVATGPMLLVDDQGSHQIDIRLGH